MKKYFENLSLLMLIIFSMYSINSHAQTSQEERALIEYAKKYDKEQMDRRVNELESRIEGTYTSKSKANQAWSTLGYIFGASFVAMVIYEITKSAKGLKDNKNSDNESFGEKMNKITRDSERRHQLFHNPLHGIQNEKLTGMTVSEIKESTGSLESIIKKELIKNKLICSDFDGVKFSSLMGEIASTDSTDSKIYNKRFNEVEKYLRDIEHKSSLEIEDSNAKNNNQQIMYFKASTDPEKEIASEIFVSCFDSSGSLVPGCYIQNSVDIFFGDFDFCSGIDFVRTYNLENIINGPSFYSDTIRVDAFKIPENISYVLLSVFTAFDPFSFPENEEEIKLARKNQNRFTIEVKPYGLKSLPEKYEWSVKGNVNKMLILGYLKKISESSWEFKKLENKFTGSKFLNYDDNNSVKRVCEKLQEFVKSNIV